MMRRPSATCRLMSFPPLAFVDLETTGATATADRITEIGIIEVDADGVREWSTLVNPGVPISSFIESLTGISSAMVASAPAFAEVASEVLARLEGRLFIAHNARFDYGFLKNEFKRAGLDFRATVLCTVKLSRKLFPQHPRHNLDSLIERHGLQVSARHRALGDARLIHQFWQQLLASVEPEVLAATVAKLTARPSLPANLDAAAIDALPDGPGRLPVSWRKRLAAVCWQEHRHPQTGARAFRRRPRHGEGNEPRPASAPRRMHSDRWRDRCAAA
jgi:DNA polymerase-3 subunit epsilon